MTDWTQEAQKLWGRLPYAYDPYYQNAIKALASALQSTYERGKMEERERCEAIAEGNFDNRIRRKIDKCSHNKFGWEDCTQCVAEAIRNKP